MANETKYQKAVAEYRELASKATAGDKQAHKDKAKAMNEVRALEREAAREGVVISGGQKVRETSSKRSLQEAYVRKFDDETPVQIGGKTTTLRKFHAERLLGRTG